MNLELVKKIGAAFMSGFFYARRHDLALDAAKWITVHPNGKGINAKGGNIKGRPCLIDSETGEILGGMGGKFTGRHISAMAQKGANEQPGAQMQITARNPKHKAEAMNGQRIGFKQVNGATGGQALAQLAKKKAAGAGNSAVSSENSGNSAIAGARAYWQSQNKKDPNIPVSASEQIKDTKIKSPENLEALSQYGHVYMDDYGHKRLYLDPKTLGMEVKKTANGKLISATVNGEKLSNIKAKGLLSGDTYIDLKTGELTGGHSERFNDYFRDKINNIVSENFVSGTTTEHKKADWEIKKDRVDDYEAKGKEIDKQIHDLVDNPMMNYSDPKFQRQLKELRDKRQKLDQENAKTYEEFFKARPEQNNFTVSPTTGPTELRITRKERRAYF